MYSDNMINLNSNRSINSPFPTLEGTGLDFDIDTTEIYLPEPYGSHDQPCFDKKAVVKLNDDGTPNDFWVVGTDYYHKTHTLFFNTIEDQIVNHFDPNHLRDVKVITRSSRNGRWGLRDYTFPNVSVKITSKQTSFETTIELRIIAWNGLDSLTANNYLLGAIDNYCLNGCVWTQGNEEDWTKVKRRNTKLFDMDQFATELGHAAEIFYHRSKEFQTMADTALPLVTAFEFIEKLELSESKKKGLKDLTTNEFGVRGGNIFALHSAFTQYSSHKNEDYFRTRTLKYEDSEPEVMFKREEEVLNILTSKAWKDLLEHNVAA